MTLYEEMKNGISAEQLLREFTEELREAQEQINAEKEKEAAAATEELAEIREDLAYCLVEYIEALIGEEDVISVKDAKKALLALEDQLKKVTDLTDILSEMEKYKKSEEKIAPKEKNTVNPPAPWKVKITSPNIDDQILGDFLKTLK